MDAAVGFDCLDAEGETEMSNYYGRRLGSRHEQNERCRRPRKEHRRGHLGVEGDKVVDSANLMDDLGANSLDAVELTMAFEEEFGVEIPDDQAETSVGRPWEMMMAQRAKAHITHVKGWHPSTF